MFLFVLGWSGGGEGKRVEERENEEGRERVGLYCGMVCERSGGRREGVINSLNA